MARTRNSGANLGFEDKLWAAADKLRGNMDAAEYKHVVLVLDLHQEPAVEAESPDDLFRDIFICWIAS